jgi:formylglycine-generating enzyme required for sulfatase activity
MKMRKKALFPLMVALTTIVLLGCPNPVTPPTDTVINIVAIPGVTAPVLGATPVTAITETAHYTGTITWNTTPTTFAATTVYTATITLTAKAGFTLTGVAANSFTVAGATATNAVNSGVVTAVFPATGVADYTSANIGTLKFVPAGRFQRDATGANISVITQPYRMSAHEITRAQFAAMLTTDPSNTTYSTTDTSNPVQMTNWYHAIAFCNKLSLAEGLTPVYAVTGVNFSTLTYAAIPTTTNVTWDAATATWANNGYRLPTEMEWMWAGMGAPADGQGGGTNTTGYAKAFAGSTGSNAIGDYAVYDYYGTGLGKTLTERSNPVGSKLANELGLYDMSGNVWEWTWDWYATYPTGTQTDYRGAASGAGRVLRGGSWGGVATDCSVASRGLDGPSYQYGSIGFRVVRP